MTVKIIEQKCEPFVGQRPAPTFWGRCERLNNKVSDEILSSLKMFNWNEWGNYKYSFRSSLFSVHDFRSYMFLPFVFSYTWIEYFINYTCSVLFILNRDFRFSGCLVNGYCYLSWICYAINCKKKGGRQRSKLSSLMVHVNGKDRRLKII